MKIMHLDLNTKIYAITIDYDDTTWNDDLKLLYIFETEEEYEEHRKMVDDIQEYTGHTSRLLYKK